MKGDPQIVRKGFGLKQEIAGQLSSDYASELVDRARASDYRLAWPGLAVRIAKEFGFCYGVERAIDYAYETRKKFPDRRLFLTGEIIHNPRVNLRLREIGYQFLDGSYDSTLGYRDLAPDDVVLLPAFGVTTGDARRAEAGRLPPGRHDLRLGAERLATSRGTRGTASPA